MIFPKPKSNSTLGIAIETTGCSLYSYKYIFSLSKPSQILHHFLWSLHCFHENIKSAHTEKNGPSTIIKRCSNFFFSTMRGKYPNTEIFLVRIFSYSIRVRENTDQKKLRIQINSDNTLLQINIYFAGFLRN